MIYAKEKVSLAPCNNVENKILLYYFLKDTGTSSGWQSQTPKLTFYKVEIKDRYIRWLKILDCDCGREKVK